MVRAKHLMRPTLAPWVLVVLLAWFITGATGALAQGAGEVVVIPAIVGDAVEANAVVPEKRCNSKECRPKRPKHGGDRAVRRAQGERPAEAALARRARALVLASGRGTKVAHALELHPRRRVASSRAGHQQGCD